MRELLQRYADARGSRLRTGWELLSIGVGALCVSTAIFGVHEWVAQSQPLPQGQLITALGALTAAAVTMPMGMNIIGSELSATAAEMPPAAEGLPDVA